MIRPIELKFGMFVAVLLMKIHWNFEHTGSNLNQDFWPWKVPNRAPFQQRWRCQFLSHLKAKHIIRQGKDVRRCLDASQTSPMQIYVQNKRSKIGAFWKACRNGWKTWSTVRTDQGTSAHLSPTEWCAYFEYATKTVHAITVGMNLCLVAISLILNFAVGERCTGKWRWW